MNVRKVRELKGANSPPPSSGAGGSAGAGAGDANSHPLRSPLSVSMGSMSDLRSPASPLPQLTLDVEDYLNQLAGKHDATASAALTAHLSLEELQQHTAATQAAVEASKQQQDGIAKGLQLLRNLEATVLSAVEEDTFADRLIHHQRMMVQRAREERRDPTKVEANLEADVKRLERHYQRAAAQLSGSQNKRHADHDAFMAAFKQNAKFMLELERTVDRRLSVMSDRTANMRRSVQLLRLKLKDRADKSGDGKDSDTPLRRPSTMGQLRQLPKSGSGTGNGSDPSPRQSTSTSTSNRRLVRPSSKRSTKKRPQSGTQRANTPGAAELAALERDKATAQRTSARLQAQNKRLQKQLQEQQQKVIEKENLIVALRRQQTEQVIALQKKIVSISKEIHRMHSEAGE